MSVMLSIVCDELEAEDLHALTVDLVKTLKEETDLVTSLAETPGEPGQRGMDVLLGQIILTAFSSGAVVALFNILKTYFERKSTLKVNIQRGDGKSFEIRAENLTKGQINETIRIASDFLGDVS